MNGWSIRHFFASILVLRQAWAVRPKMQAETRRKFPGSNCCVHVGTTPRGKRMGSAWICCFCVLQWLSTALHKDMERADETQGDLIKSSQGTKTSSMDVGI